MKLEFVVTLLAIIIITIMVSSRNQNHVIEVSGVKYKSDKDPYYIGNGCVSFKHKGINYHKCGNNIKYYKTK